jgi:hypothetical protein
MNTRIVLAATLAAAASACATPPRFAEYPLERSLFPGLSELGTQTVEQALDRRIELHAPLSAGVIWLTEDTDETTRTDEERAFSDYERTGVLEQALATLRRPPFGAVGALPTVPTTLRSGDAKQQSDAIAVVRAACANFQYEVALVLQTGVAVDDGFNPFAIGYLPVITAPLFPGSDRAVASTAELIAIDVRSGVPLGCGRGRDAVVRHLLFPWQTGEKTRELMEESLGRSLAAAVVELVPQLEARLGPPK